MKLLYSPASPYVRKVMLTAHELGLVDRLEMQTGGSSPLDPNPDIVAVNPVGRIPALITDDGVTLSDSRVICRYLNHVASGSLYAAGEAEFPMIAREALAEAMIDSALLVVYEGRLRPEDKQFQPWVDGQKRKIVDACTRLNQRIDEYSGDISIDKIALGSALGYLDFRMPDLGWRDGRPGLADWFGAFSERASMQATAPAG